MQATKLLLKGVATVAALALVLAACGSSANAGATDPTGAPAATAAPASAAAEGLPVAVAVGETSVEDMYMNIDPATVTHGTVTFTVVNEGVKLHEFVILSTDVKAADLTVEGAEVVEDDYLVIDEVEDLAGGDSDTLTVDLEPGDYALICNLPAHFQMGMYSNFTVE